MRNAGFLAMVVILAAQVSAAPRQDAEQPVDTRMESIGLFKNGLAVVRRTVELPGPGVYLINDVPKPVHGTLAIESETPVAVQTTTRDVEAKPSLRGLADLHTWLGGRHVTIHFRDGVPSVEGKVIELTRPYGDEAWSRAYDPNRYGYPINYALPGSMATGGRYLLLDTGDGRSLVDTSLIAHMSIADDGETIRQRKAVLLLSVGEEAKGPVTVTLSYLTRGIAWAPDYRVNLRDGQRLVIEQHAVVRNELGELKDVELRLISGFPAVQFGHVNSPLSPDVTWAAFFQQLNPDPRRGGSRNAAVMSQVANASSGPGVEQVDLGALADSESVDLHFQSIGRRSLAEGDALALSVARAEADYERIVEWIVPDTRDENGRRLDVSRRQQSGEAVDDSPWDAIRFKNPLSFPMTTAPATISTAGRFAGQQMARWTNPGEETTLRITQALSLRTRASEHEQQEANREPVWIAGSRFMRVHVQGELHVQSHRGEVVKMVIRRQFSGDLIEADGEPLIELREQGVWSANRRNELLWTLELKPGEQRTLKYSYTVNVPQ